MNDGLDWFEWTLSSIGGLGVCSLSRVRQFWEAVNGLSWFKMRGHSNWDG